MLSDERSGVVILKILTFIYENQWRITVDAQEARASSGKFWGAASFEGAHNSFRKRSLQIKDPQVMKVLIRPRHRKNNFYKLKRRNIS